jgi:pyruvate ferredoxin oxidoreductase alpha subunit
MSTVVEQTTQNLEEEITQVAQPGEKRFMSGSEAVAHGVRLSRIEVTSAYPITPNVLVLQTVANMIERGELDALSIEAESELGAVYSAAGASWAGCRTFMCTCSQGLALLREGLWAASGMAAPIVFAISSRAVGAPQTFAPDLSDALSERDASVVQVFCENVQEALASTVMAYNISEHSDVLLPSFVVFEGFRLSHTNELVSVPDQEDVDAFLPPYQPKHAFVDFDYPIQSGLPSFNRYDEFKYQQHRALINAKQVIKDVGAEFGRRFGRSYGLTESYRCDDADLILVSMATLVGQLRDVVDDLRDEGHKVGLLKLRVFRPFPEEEVAAALGNAKKALVLDRPVSPGAKGISYLEVKAAMPAGSPVLISNYIATSRDVEKPDLIEVVRRALARDDEYFEWAELLFNEEEQQRSGWDNYQKMLADEHPVTSPMAVDEDGIMAQGNPFCGGCGGVTAVKLATKALGRNTVVSSNAGCLGTAGNFPQTPWKVPMIQLSWSHAGAGLSGVETALRKKGIDGVCFNYGGDGAMVDIGLQTISGAIERGHKIIFFLYDNEAYMNTGVQRSGSTPYGARTKTTPGGKKQQRKDILKIIEAHAGVYVATVSPAFPNDLMRKVRKARELDGPSFIYSVAPCPPGWESEDDQTIQLARLAVETGYLVLYEFQDDVRTCQHVPKQRKPIEEFLKLQGRFNHLQPEQVAAIQTYIDRRFKELTGQD